MDSLIITEFFVPGISRTAGSKSAFKDKYGKIHLTHAGKYTKDWMDSVKWFALKEYGQKMVLLTCPLSLKLTFYLKRPSGHYRTGKYAGEIKESFAQAYPTPKPDLTKLVRAAEDALTGIVWKDDSQVVKQATKKVYCGPEKKIGVYIAVSRVL